LNQLQSDPTTASKKLIVAGCLPAAQPELVTKYVPEASLLGPKAIAELPRIIGSDAPLHILQSDSPRPEHLGQFPGVIAIIPIAEGCVNSCGYCIVKQARGDLKSVPIESIAKQVELTIEQGTKEIDITAQDTGCYGWDIGTTLPNLLTRLIEIRGSFRIRVGMMNPDSTLKILPDLLRVYKSPKIYKFLHLPVQSGSNLVLSQMGRKYRVEDFKEIVRNFKMTFPTISIATDFIVGFPGETEQAFESSRALLEEIKPDKTHVARFSPRPLTEGANLPQISSDIKKRRSAILAKLRLEIGKTENEKWVGKQGEILITSISPKVEIEGRLDNYKPVILPEVNIDERDWMGTRINVEITGARSVSLIGKIVERENST
jgi:MiaB-like tRNA modifying enzyme